MAVSFQRVTYSPASGGTKQGVQPLACSSGRPETLLADSTRQQEELSQVGEEEEQRQLRAISWRAENQEVANGVGGVSVGVDMDMEVSQF